MQALGSVLPQPDPQAPDRSTPMDIIAVDWGKTTAKRAAFHADVRTRTVSRLDLDGRLASLLRFAQARPGPVLIGIDAAIGYPRSAWTALCATLQISPPDFLAFLRSKDRPDDFFDHVRTPSAWTATRPFIRPPHGRKWSLRAYVAASNDGLHRHIDRRLGANPLFVTSGLPGSVGSGTIALWQELIALEDAEMPSVWPFHGTLTALLAQPSVVLGELYPAACYGMALAETLPAARIRIAKTKAPARRQALAQLQSTAWLQAASVTLRDVSGATNSEDQFDALMSATALLRMALAGRIPRADIHTDPVEGGILGADGSSD